MKHILTSMLILIFMSASVACSAEKDVKHKVMYVNDEQKAGLGAAVSELDDEHKETLGVSKGALIMDVIEDTEAEKIGLKKNDVIIRFDGKDIESASELRDLVDDLDAEKEVELVVVREGKNMTFKARMKEIPPRHIAVKVDGNDIMVDVEKALEKLDERGLIWNEEAKGGFLGVSAEDITDQMLDYFEVKHGVLVEKVHKDTPAEKAGLKAGDVIVKIEGREIHDYGDLTRTLNYYNAGEKVTIEYVRKGKSSKVQVELAEKKHKAFNFMLPKGDRFMHFGPAGLTDSLKHIKKEMKVIRERLKDEGERIKSIDLDLDFFII